jgi:hypothetical protein
MRQIKRAARTDLRLLPQGAEMNALPKIEVWPIRHPIYRNTHIADYGQWSVMNLQALTDYWNALVSPDAAGPLGEDDFFIFCRIQHERELDHVEELRRCYGSNGDRV